MFRDIDPVEAPSYVANLSAVCRDAPFERPTASGAPQQAVLKLHVLQCDWGPLPEVQQACTHVDSAQLITVLLPCLGAGAMQTL